MRHKRRIAALIFFAIVLLTATLALGTGAVEAQSNTVTTNTGANIRSGPSLTTTVIGSVPAGTILTVTGNSGTGWWRVDTSFGVGWVSARIVTFSGDRNSVPITTEPTGEEAPSTVIAHLGPAKVYSNPNLSSFVIYIIPTGESVDIIGLSDNGWYQVETAAGVGYVNFSNVARRGPTEQLPFINDPGPSFRGPTIQLLEDKTVINNNGNAIGILPAGTILPVSGRNADNTRWRVATEFGVGWISVGNVSLAGVSRNIPIVSTESIPGPPEDDIARATATVIVDRKLFYAKPSYTVVMLDARRGEEASIIGRSEDGLWLKVVIRNNVVWMNFSGVTISGDIAGLPVVDDREPPNNRIIVNTFALNVRSGPGPFYTVLTTVAGGSVLQPTGRTSDGVWYRVEGDYGVGWVNVKYILFRGEIGTIPFATEPVGELLPNQAYLFYDTTVYTEPNEVTTAGVLTGDALYNVVARRADWVMYQLDTPLGLVWVYAKNIAFRGDYDSVPVAQ